MEFVDKLQCTATASNYIKTHLVGTEFLHEWQTDVKKLIRAFNVSYLQAQLNFPLL